MPPDPNALDADWDGQGEEDPDSTRAIDSRELFEQAGFESEGEPAAASAERGRAEGPITLPPPVPMNEYVAQMMEQRPRTDAPPPASTPPAQPRRAITPPARPGPSLRLDTGAVPSVPHHTIPWEPPKVGDDFQETLGSLIDERPFGLDFDEPGVVSPPAVDPTPTPRVGGGRGAAPRGPAAPASPPKPAQRPPAAGELHEIDSPPFGREGRGAAAPQDERADIDFRLDLGFDVPDLVDDDPMRVTLPPATPPPSTLRYGLVDEGDPERRSVPADPFDSPVARRERAAAAARAPELGLSRPTATLRPSDSDQRPPVLQVDVPSLGAVSAGTLRPGEAPPSSRGEPPSERRDEMRQRFEAGDYGGALVLAEGLLEEQPSDRTARRYAESCTEMLRQMYKARIGDGSQVLRVVMSNEELRSLNLDHRAGFLLACIDGHSSIDEILDVSGMHQLEALRILFELVQENVIACDDDGRG